MDVNGSKVDCKFWFVVKGKPSDMYLGQIHLFEHQYDPKTQFWYGVADVSCSFDDIGEIFGNGGEDDFGLSITLEDGRKGMAKAIGSGQMQGSYFHVAVFGWTKLG